MPDSGDKSGSTRRKMLSLMGGGAAASLAGCSAFLDSGGDGTTTSSGTGDVSLDASQWADQAQEAWETVVDNPGPDAQETRNEAYLDIEEAVRNSVIVLNFMHDFSERFWYDYVDVPKIGALGQSFQQLNTVELTNGDTELNRTNSTHAHVDPIESDDEASSTVITQIYEPLVTYPNGVPEMENQLIEGFELSEDQTTYTFNLKEGVQFHESGEMTADDVVYSWRRMTESENSVRANFMLSSPDGVGAVHETDDEGNVVPGSLAVEAVDDYTVELEVRNPNPAVMDVLTYTAFSIIPEGKVGDVEGYEGEVAHQDFRVTATDGTGPFEMDTFEIDNEVRLTTFEDYHDEVASVDSVHFAIIEDPEALFTYAVEQNADIFGIPTSYYDPSKIDASADDRGRDVGTYGELENGETVNYLGLPELVTRYFGFNAGNVPIEVRQAFAYVLNQQEIVDDVFAGRGVPAYSFTPPGIWPTGQDGYEEFQDSYPFSPNETDIDGAREVLESAGYTEDDPFEITCTTYVSNTYQDAAGLLRDKLSGNGVEMELEEAQFGTLVSRGYEGNLEMYSLGWGWSWESVAYGHFGFEPKNTDTSGMPADNNGYYLDWHTELSENSDS
ncbi:ABC transporter substrate-binding protein [Halapricum sp. CBA1109]|uniref:ABC transporter substrate-binding protein n=1 Tax=Halapricum sp. CBA1109 TaxID=2668068 RepID=UPI0018D24F55|nr:ABC transporter substrate-binding protein [Halapricum sp. CBA1109]